MNKKQIEQLKEICKKMRSEMDGLSGYIGEDGYLLVEELSEFEHLRGCILEIETLVGESEEVKNDRNQKRLDKIR